MSNFGAISFVCAPAAAETIRNAYELGLREFGENYVQEFEGKAPEVADLLRPRRVLDLVVALGDGEVPRHARSLGLARERGEDGRELLDLAGVTSPETKHEARHFDRITPVPSLKVRMKQPGVH